MTAASIIIPAFEAQDFIGDAVASVLEQKNVDCEIVIASDDGRDYLAALKTQGINDARLRCVTTGGIGTGAASARNAALSAAEGRVIFSLDADDFLPPKALEVMVPLALTHGAAYSDIIFLDFASGKRLHNCNRPMSSGLLTLEQLLTSNLHTFAGIAFDRQRLPDLRWSGWLPRWEDMYFVADACDRLGKIWYEAQPLYVYRRREGSICNRPETAQEFLDGAALLEARLEKDCHLLSHTSGSRQIMQRYLKRNQEFELLFEQAMQRGTCSDYQDFMLRNLERYYQLP